ncbi:hypothetical protein Droror1_Dr00019086 [Drosera rotundifolia]
MAPSMTTKTSDAPAGVCGNGMTPSGARSNLAMEMPSPFTPGNWAAKAGVTAAFIRFVVLPGPPKPELTKSFTVTAAGFLQPSGPSGTEKSATQKSTTEA